MAPGEQSAMLFILEHLRSKLSIEIGAFLGGNLQAIAKYSDRVYSTDVDAGVSKLLNGRFLN
jgi:hypothetical protein